MVMSMLLDAAKMLAALAVAGAGMMAYPRTRRVVFATVKFAKSHMTPWMVAVLGVLVLIPGFVDEVIGLPVLFACMLRTRANRAEFASAVSAAWKGEPCTGSMKRDGRRSGH